ncbi:BTAD domain-containing putative transcriptional regulator [Nocardia sp. NPDC006044]|uniref:AfsR/SARP family transcriptional regulator n=1 Tax=Nocardia sp. NPDC006044 TaxID=3364306 RepID=UPI00369EDEAF
MFETERSTDAADVRFTVLGRVTIRRGGATAVSERPRTQAVLAALLFAAGRPLTAAQLVDAVWGADRPADAVASLRSHVRLLRKVVEPDRAPRTASILVSIGDGYELRVPRSAVDAGRAEALAEAAETARKTGDFAHAHSLLGRALELWRGEVLAGVPGPLAAQQRRRLSELRADLLESRLELDLRLGRHDQVVGELAAAGTEFPFREHLRGLWMTALYRCGRRSEALAVYTQTRAMLVDELGIEPGPELAALHRGILEDDLPPAATLLGAAGTVSVAPADVRPAQLPRGIADFTGRETVAHELCAILTDFAASPPVVVLTGMGGVGKTTLATHIARQVRTRFPDGQLYADLRGMDDSPADPAAVLASFLRALAVPDSDIPRTAAERAGLLRGLLTGRRMLLVLDNAGNLDQVTPLLPGEPGCAVLITSRAVLVPLPDATIRHLDVLSDTEARNLLSRIIGAQRTAAEPEAAQSIVDACAHLPLAIRIIGARLAARPHWSVATVAARLADEQRRLAELRCGDLAVDASFTVGYRLLDPAGARAFVMLAAPTVPDLPVAAAAAILGIDDDAATGICDSLVDLGLLQSTAPDRFSYHDLLRLFARAVAPDGDREQILTRLLDFYLATAKNVTRHRNPGHRLDYIPATNHVGRPIVTEAEAHRWLGDERSTVIALHGQIAANHPGLMPTAVNVALLMATGIDASAESGQLAEALRQLLAVAERLGDQDSEARVRLALGLVLALDLGRGEEAVTVLERAGKLLRPNGNTMLLAFVEHVLGAAELSTGNMIDAVAHNGAAAAIFRDLGDAAWEGWACATLADRCGDTAQWDRAVETAQRALRLAAELGGAPFESLALGQLGRVAILRDNDPERAMALCAEAVRVARLHERRLYLGWALYRLGEVALYCGRFTAAEIAAAEAVRILTETTDPIRRDHALHFQARAVAAQGRAAEAAELGADIAESSSLLSRTLPRPDRFAVHSPAPEVEPTRS